MNQIVLGAGIPFLIAAAVYCFHGRRASFRMLLIVPVCMALSMIWAEVPDIPRLLKMPALYTRLSRDPRCDIFYWHYSIDQVETDSWLFAPLLALMLAGLLFAVWRELSIAEKGD